MRSGSGPFLQNRSDLTRAQLERTRDLMDAHVRDAIVTDFDELIEVLKLPDPDDRHVLASRSCRSHCHIHLKDFPAEMLDRWGIEAQHPDEFLTINSIPLSLVFLQAVGTVRMRLKKPPKSVHATVKEIEPFDQFI